MTVASPAGGGSLRADWKEQPLPSPALAEPGADSLGILRRRGRRLCSRTARGVGSVSRGLVAEVEGDKVRLSANADVAVTFEEEGQ